jgi:hypothetical protein
LRKKFDGRICTRGLQLSKIDASAPRQVVGLALFFRAAMFTHDFAIIGASGVLVAGMAFWLVWLWRHVE